MARPEGAAAGAEGSAWLAVLRRYMAVVAGANLAWETTHLPLYTIWNEGSVRDKVVAVLHCTAGDVLIAAASLLGALLLVGGRWPAERYGAVAALAVAAGLGYTVYSEWLNVEVRGSWAYSRLMPIVPGIGTGLSPVAQWIVIPLAAIGWARPRTQR